MRNYALRFFEVGAILLACLLFPVSGNAGGLEVSARLEVSGKDFLARFEMINRGDEDIGIYRNSLPWINRSGVLFLKAISLTPDLVELPNKGRLYNTVGVVTLKSGEQIDGLIKVNQRFLRFDEYLEKGPILVVWVYTPRSPTHLGLPSASGFLVVPQSGAKGSM